MRSGTRKVADSKPDATARKESDTIPMTDIGKITFGICVHFPNIPAAIPSQFLFNFLRNKIFGFIFPFSLFHPSSFAPHFFF